MARSQSSAIALWLLLGVIALIVYGSLYPFDFNFDGGRPTLLTTFKHLSWARAGRADQLRNVLLYMPLGFCLVLWLQRRSSHLVLLLLATTLGCVLSLCMEMAQVYVPTRVASYLDVTLNALGTLLGAIAGLTWRSLAGLVYLPPNTRTRSGDRSALVLLITWVSWRLAEFTPHLSLTRLKSALQPLLDFDASLLLTIRYLLLWLVVSQAVMSYAQRQRSNEFLVTIIAVVLIGRVLFVSPALIPSELLALILLLPVLIVLHKFSAVPQSAVIFSAFAAWFVYDSLSPFYFGGFHADLDLWPFMSWIKQGMPIDADTLLRKLFTFGALIWLLKDVGIAMKGALIIVVGVVFGIELLHLWQPARIGSITDPVLALCMGMVMRLVSDERQSKSSTLKRR